MSAARDLSTDALRRAVFTEAGRMMLTGTQEQAYRAELIARRSEVLPCNTGETLDGVLHRA